MTVRQDKKNSEFGVTTQLALRRILEITYDDDCDDARGWNLSNIDTIPISILNLKEQRTITDLDREDTTFMWKTLLIDCIINMQYEVHDNRAQLVDILKQKYEKDAANLDSISDFHLNYKSSDAIRWYKKQSCIYQELNKALRSSCINLIFAYRFFLRDLSKQLREEQKHLKRTNGGNILYLYRGQRTSNTEIEKLKKLEVDSLISVDSFFSTSRNENTANGFMQIKKKEDINLIPLRHEIKCDLRLGTKPYADISAEKLGDFSHEEEVLFMVGTIFRFKSMFYDNKLKCWRIKLKLIDEHNHRLFNLYQSIKYEMEEKTDLLTLGGLLNLAGDYEHALRFYLRSFVDLQMSDDYPTQDKQQQLIRSVMGVANVECQLGRYDLSIDLFNQIITDINKLENIYERKYQLATAYYNKSLPLSEKGDYLNALKQCQKSLKIYLKRNDHTDSFVASCYEMIGNIYGNLARLERIKHNPNSNYQHIQTAYQYYNKTLAIRKKLHKNIPNHHEVCVTYINIGELFRDMEKPDEALRYTITAYNSFRKAFPKSHNWIGIALDNIGEIYVQQQKFTEAKEKYDQAIEVYKKTLPDDHRYIGETLHNIGKLYCCISAFDKALDYFNQAKTIYDKKISKEHYLAVELREQTNYAAAQLRGVIGYQLVFFFIY